MNEATQRLVTDMKADAADAGERILATAEESAKSVVSAREKARATLAKAQATIRAAQKAAADRACATARAADDSVHESPWAFMGAAALIGVAVGFWLGRR